MKNIFSYSILLLSLTLLTSTAFGNGNTEATERKTVNLMIDGLPAEEGSVWVLIYDASADFVGEGEKAAAFYELDANQTRYQLELKDLALGSYAFLIYYDRNGNGELDKNWSGRPLEDYVYSSLDKFTGLPSFSEAAIEVDESTNAIYLKLNKVKAKALTKKIEKVTWC